MNQNDQYWNNFYLNDNELPLTPSDFAVYVLRFLQTLSDKKKSYKNLLSIGCGNGRDAYFFHHKAMKSQQ